MGTGFGDEQHGHDNQRQADEVDPYPAYGFHGLSCKQAGDGGGGEHQKIVHALYLAFFLRSISEAHELSGTNKGEIPAYAEQYQGGEKVHIALPEQIGAYQPDRRLPMAQQCQGRYGEVQAIATAATGLACFIFRFLRRPLLRLKPGSKQKLVT